MMLENFTGLAIGLATFLTIGLFHPLVIKAEYHFGTRSWIAFFLLGVLGAVVSFFCESTFFSAVAGVFAFSSLWSIREVFQQAERVRKGWFPANPRRS
ncbi:MAG: DUF4491 family protein [Prevotellaceae bacterium]|nr:DUF4491 family protein [Prevotellaceae bacterium]